MVDSACTLIDIYTPEGELSIHPQRAEFLPIVSDFRCHVLSNCAVYDSVFAKHLAFGKTTINCSVDAGTRETYSRIKGVDCFERLRDNLKRYGETAKLELKYILIPGVNDNEAEVDGFIRLIDDLSPSVSKVIISRDFDSITNNLPVDDHLMSLMVKLYNAAETRRLDVGYVLVGGKVLGRLLRKVKAQAGAN